MLTRRIKSNNINKTKKCNNKTKKVNNYTNRNKTKKRYKEGGTLDNLRKIKVIKKKAKGRRGIRVEFLVAKATADFFGDPSLVASHAAHQKKNPTAPIDIPGSLSGNLPGDISVKSIARTSPGQKKFTICMGDSCRTFDSFIDTVKAVAEAKDPDTIKNAAYFMAIVLRCEDEIKDKKIPLQAMVIDMRQYKKALFGNLTDDEIKSMSQELLQLEAQSKKDTYEKFKGYDTLEAAAAEGVAEEADKSTKAIEAKLDGMNKILESRGAKLRVRLSIGNWFSKSGSRQPRILASFSWSPESPRALASEAPFSKPFSELVKVMDKSTSSGEPDTVKIVKRKASSNILNPPIFKAPTPRRSTASRASSVSNINRPSSASRASRLSAKNKPAPLLVKRKLSRISERRSSMRSSRLGRTPGGRSSYRPRTPVNRYGYSSVSDPTTGKK